jgi:hypothetical protein
MPKSIIIAAAGLVMAAPAAAQTAPADPATSSAPATQQVKDPNRIICERQEEIGSRLGGKKICKTAQEWQDSRQQTRDTVDDWQRQFTTNPKPGG